MGRLASDPELQALAHRADDLPWPSDELPPVSKSLTWVFVPYNMRTATLYVKACLVGQQFTIGVLGDLSHARLFADAALYYFGTYRRLRFGQVAESPCWFSTGSPEHARQLLADVPGLAELLAKVERHLRDKRGLVSREEAQRRNLERSRAGQTAQKQLANSYSEMVRSVEDVRASTLALATTVEERLRAVEGVANRLGSLEKLVETWAANSRELVSRLQYGSRVDTAAFCDTLVAALTRKLTQTLGSAAAKLAADEVLTLRSALLK